MTTKSSIVSCYTQAMGKSFLWLNDFKENPFDVDLKDLISQLAVISNWNRRAFQAK
jgi:hypothetical protein